MKNILTKNKQKEIFRKYLLNYLEENDLDASRLRMKDVESMEIKGVSRSVKRGILSQIKSGEKDEELGDQVENKKEDYAIAATKISPEVINFIHELFKQKERLQELLDGKRDRGLKKDSDEEVVILKERLSDIHKLDEQTGVFVKMNKEIHSKLKEYGRLLGLSIREMIHIGMKNTLKNLEEMSESK